MLKPTATQTEISNIAAKLDLAPVEIPENLRHLAAMDAIHEHLQMHVHAFGGYAVLARALPQHRPKIWQGKIERLGRYTLTVTEYVELVKLFDDPVLMALLAENHRHRLVDLSAIPPSENSLADLVWAWRRYSAQGQLALCELREEMIDGADTTASHVEIKRLAKESIIVLRQIGLALKARSGTK